MPIEESEFSYAILVNKDDFVKLSRMTYPKTRGPLYVIRQPIKPRFDGDRIDTVDFRLVTAISAEQAQQRYGLLVRAHTVLIYLEI